MTQSQTSKNFQKKINWDVKHHSIKGYLLTWSYWRPTTNVRHEYAWKDDTIHYQTKKSILDHLKKFFDTTDHKAVLKLVNDKLEENKRIEEQDEEDEVQEKLAFLENKVIELSKEVDDLKSKYLVTQASQVPPPPVPPPPPVFDESYNDEYTAVPRPTLIVPVVYESGDDDSSSDYEPEIEEEEEDDDDISQALEQKQQYNEEEDEQQEEQEEAEEEEEVDSVYDSDDNADDHVDDDDNDEVDEFIQYLEVVRQKVEADFENPDNIPVDDDDTYDLYAELRENYLYGVKEDDDEEEEDRENNYVTEDSDSGYGNYDDEFIKYLDSIIDGNI